MKLFIMNYGEEGYVYVTEEEYEAMKQVFKYLNVPYELMPIEYKMYRIRWFNYIDDEWQDIWCTKDDYLDTLKEVIAAGVSYEVVEFN